MKKNKKVKNLIVIGIILTILILILVVLGIRNINEKIKLRAQKENESELDGITYQIYKYAEGQGRVYINFKADKGIAEIHYPNEENVLNCNGKKNVAIEYNIEKDKTYEFKMNTTDGREIVSNETVNEEYLSKYGIDYSEKKTGEGYRIVNIDYKSKVTETCKNYYKVGENGEWEEYEGSLWLFDYDLVKDNLVNTEDNTVTLYTKSVNSINEEVILSKKYDVDINATETSLTEESLLEAASKDYFTAGTYKITVQDETYSLHVYEFDESQTWSDNVTFGSKKDVATSTSDMAKNMVVVKVNGDLTIEEGATVTAYADENGYGGPKGMMLYVTGTLTNNGTISMTARGAYAEGQNVYLYKNNDNTYEYVPSTGGAGGTSVRIGPTPFMSWMSGASGRPGSISSSLRGSGGGGSGGADWNAGSGGGMYYESGAGEYGTSYSGGTGGGGVMGSGTSVKAGDGNSYGGQGGSGYASGSGAGNPGGTNGTGGLLTIYANSIVNNNKIEAKGLPGGGAWPWTGGGSSGGGSINIFYRDQIENGTITADGGTSAAMGGAGGEGSVVVGSIASGKFVEYNEKL